MGKRPNSACSWMVWATFTPRVPAPTMRVGSTTNPLARASLISL